MTTQDMNGARRDHRRNVGTRPRARPRVARPRSARRLRGTKPGRRGTCLPRAIRRAWHCRRRLTEGGHLSDRDTGARRIGRRRRARQQRIVARARSAGPARRHRMRRSRTGVATNVLGPFRLTKALLGSLAASARGGRHPLVVNVSSDAAMNPYANWGAYRCQQSRAPSSQSYMGRGARSRRRPGRIHRPRRHGYTMHALAVPDADRSTLKRPDVAAREVADLIAAVQSVTTPGHAAADHEVLQ